MWLLLGLENTYLLGVCGGSPRVIPGIQARKISQGGKSLNTKFPEAKTYIQSKLCVLTSVTFTGISGAAVVTFNVSAPPRLITADQTAPAAICLVLNVP